MCTFWCVEALTRAGAYDKVRSTVPQTLPPSPLRLFSTDELYQKYLVQAINMFENLLSFSNHVNMFSEEISRSGEQLGNTPQAFSHLALISAAFNLDRVTGGSGGL